MDDRDYSRMAEARRRDDETRKELAAMRPCPCCGAPMFDGDPHGQLIPICNNCGPEPSPDSDSTPARFVPVRYCPRCRTDLMYSEKAVSKRQCPVCKYEPLPPDSDSTGRVTLRRWIGGGMPPGPWRSDPSPFAVANDTSEVEAQEFIDCAALEALAGELDALAKHHHDLSAAQPELAHAKALANQALGDAYRESARRLRALLPTEPPEEPVSDDPR